MLRLGAIFIVLCMVLIAASIGAGLYLLVGLKAFESLIVAVAVLTGLATYNAVTSRLRDRSDVGGQIADLSRGTGDLARQVAELGRRTAALEGQADKIIDAFLKGRFRGAALPGVDVTQPSWIGISGGKLYIVFASSPHERFTFTLEADRVTIVDRIRVYE